MYMKTQTKSYCCKALTDASTGLYGRCAYQEMKTRNKKKRVLSRTKHSLGVLAFEEPESAGTSKFIPFRCPLYLTNCVQLFNSEPFFWILSLLSDILSSLKRAFRLMKTFLIGVIASL